MTTTDDAAGSTIGYSRRDAAEALGCISLATLDRMIKAKQIRVARLRHRIVVPRSEIERLLAIAEAS